MEADLRTTRRTSSPAGRDVHPLEHRSVLPLLRSVRPASAGHAGAAPCRQLRRHGARLRPPSSTSSRRPAALGARRDPPLSGPREARIDALRQRQVEVAPVRRRGGGVDHQGPGREGSSGEHRNRLHLRQRSALGRASATRRNEGERLPGGRRGAACRPLRRPARARAARTPGDVVPSGTSTSPRRSQIWPGPTQVDGGTQPSSALDRRSDALAGALPARVDGCGSAFQPQDARGHRLLRLSRRDG